jgi:hypothetical protein
MAEIPAILGIVLALEIAFPCALIAWRLLSPATVERARLRLDRTPWKCFWLGSVVSIIVLVPAAILLIVPVELTRIMGCVLVLVFLAFAGVGAAGWAARIGERLSRTSDTVRVPAARMRCAIVFELGTGLWLGILTTVVVLPLIAIVLDFHIEMTWLVVCSVLFAVPALAGLGVAAWARERDTQMSPPSGSSASSAAPFMRGALALVLAAAFPIAGWLVVTPFVVVTAAGAAVFSVLRWTPKTAASSASDSTAGRALVRKRTVLTAVSVWVLPILAFSLLVTACDEGPVKPIPNSLLYPLVPQCDKFIRYQPVDYPAPIAHVPVPQHPFMGPNPGNNMHSDAYMSDTYEESGPLGVDAEVVSRTQGFGGYGTICFDSEGRLVGVYGNARIFQIELMDPYTLEELASYDLPPRPWNHLFGGVRPWKYIGAGMYFYLDNQDRAIVPTTDNTIQVVQVPNPERGEEFELVREYDLSDYVVPGVEDSVAWLLPEWNGEYYWYATTQGIVGTVDVDSGKVRTLRLDGEIIENSFAVGEDGIYIISDRALYRFSQDGTGNILVDWRAEYDRGPAIKPGHITRGSGTSVALAGGTDGLVVITDNAEPRINVLFFRRSDGATVCSTPLFEEGKSGTDLTAIAFEQADENGEGTGVYSAIVENNWGHHMFPFSRTVPGLTRVDATRHEDGTYTCEEVWASGEESIGGFRLSLGNGLVYMYGKTESGPITKWYFIALDFATGDTVYKKLTGTGLGYNNWQGSLFLHPDGMAYSTTIFGLVMMLDGGTDP